MVNMLMWKQTYLSGGAKPGCANMLQMAPRALSRALLTPDPAGRSEMVLKEGVQLRSITPNAVDKPLQNNSSG